MSQAFVILALPLGFVAGAFAAFFVARRFARLLARSIASSASVRRGSVVGAAFLLLPGAFGAISIGGTLGGGWAERLLGEHFVPLGLFAGIALVFAVSLSFGATLGALLGRAFASCVHSRSNAV